MWLNDMLRIVSLSTEIMEFATGKFHYFCGKRVWSSEDISLMKRLYIIYTLVFSVHGFFPVFFILHFLMNLVLGCKCVSSGILQSSKYSAFKSLEGQIIFQTRAPLWTKDNGTQTPDRIIGFKYNISIVPT